MSEARRAQDHRQPETLARYPLPEVMACVVREIAHISEQIREVDEALGELLNASVPLDVKTCQNVDLVRQEMEGVQGFLLALSDTIAPDGTCDPVSATRNLRLRAQKQRLRSKWQG